MKRLTCPNSVRVLGRTYRISFEDLHGHAFGFCQPNQQVILIQPGMIEDEEKDTVLHEVIHAVDYLMQLGLTEDQVRSTATGLYAVMKDNPKLATYLFETFNTNKRNDDK